MKNILIVLFVITSFLPACLYPSCNQNNQAIKKTTYENKRIALKEREINPVRIAVKGLLKFYQKFITTQDNHECQFKPGCSSYAMQAFNLYNPIKATLMTSDRLLRCNPLAIDYYPKDQDGFLIDTLIIPATTEHKGCEKNKLTGKACCNEKTKELR
jgi:putative membrane protein insertion efficiency factor